MSVEACKKGNMLSILLTVQYYQYTTQWRCTANENVINVKNCKNTQHVIVTELFECFSVLCAPHFAVRHKCQMQQGAGTAIIGGTGDMSPQHFGWPWPPDQGLWPCIPLGAPPLDPRPPTIQKKSPPLARSVSNWLIKVKNKLIINRKSILFS